MRKLLIDADILLYRACASVEREIEFEEDVWVLYTDENEAIEAFNNSVGELLSQADTYGYLLCFSDAKNFRKDLSAEYKGNRTQRKPMGFKSIRERILTENEGRSIIYPRIEADDVIGILATTYGTDYIIWSADKDLKQIPGNHLTVEGIVSVSLEEADSVFYTQTLTGDTTDNYKGCPGVGPVKAAKVLAAYPDDPWTAVISAYASVGISEEDALTQARLARILRSDDWNFDTKEVRLWQPQSGTSKQATASAA